MNGITDSRRASLGAEAIFRAFDGYLVEFRSITGRARHRFENRAWRDAQYDTQERLSLYGTVLAPLVAEIQTMMGDRVNDKLVWAGMKAAYSALISDRDDFDIAETFFNSVTRRIFHTVGVDSSIEFVDTDFVTPPTHSRHPVYRTYQPTNDTAALIEAILCDVEFEVPFQDLARDARLVAERVERRLHEVGALREAELAEVVEAVFYRGKGAYLVGRLFSGAHDLPIALALLNTDGCIVVDAVLLHDDELSVLFSFTRSHFQIDTQRPYDLVEFLQALMPRKRRAEIYISLGFHKHGKTELYRALLNHLERSAGTFVTTRGTKGLVMIVFTMPGYDLVFKVIRDRFPAQKQISRRRVMERYRQVFHHDRVGRLVDAQEFEYLAFARDRFSDDLLAELTGEASETVRLQGDRVVINHVYVERRVIPLDIYVREARQPDARRAVVDYGRCIKDLAATDIFPGDVLLKNFGVTRQGRIVFYDYDELSTLLDCSFRRIPEPVHPEDEFSAEPWYSVAESDVFPEELERFLGLQSSLREIFLKHHRDLFDVPMWHEVQARLRAGEIIEIAPYRTESRLHP